MHNEQLTLRLQRLRPAADLPLPQYMTPGSAGIDLQADIESHIEVAAGEWQLVPTGIAIEVPIGYEAQIRPRSGLAVKHGLSLLNSPGTIDSDYRGEIQVILVNHGGESYRVERGDRIAQMVIAPVARVTIEEVESLSATTRGEGGFGHTGN